MYSTAISVSNAYTTVNIYRVEFTGEGAPPLRNSFPITRSDGAPAKINMYVSPFSEPQPACYRITATTA